MDMDKDQQLKKSASITLSAKDEDGRVITKTASLDGEREVTLQGITASISESGVVLTSAHYGGASSSSSSGVQVIAAGGGGGRIAGTSGRSAVYTTSPTAGGGSSTFGVGGDGSAGSTRKR